MYISVAERHYFSKKKQKNIVVDLYYVIKY